MSDFNLNDLLRRITSVRRQRSSSLQKHRKPYPSDQDLERSTSPPLTKTSVHWQSLYHNAILPSLLALATLGGTAQIGLFLLAKASKEGDIVSRYFWRCLAKPRQWKHGFNGRLEENKKQ
jgi:hypothetical protein